jgi:hypothetical protein
MWRLLYANLLALRFDMKLIVETNQGLERVSGDGLHINILEFVAIIINLWLAIYFIKLIRPPPGGSIVANLANITSAM